ncbi:hypothetical protein CEXT_736171 [Caerostris extrusa]|uniref:Uncharacterized protein n=1 Tax=Caerostris extrusa TaxID=172846 RepID=A0AAV4MY35_CAEEX|nr:hypothetical protein CEXT_736171 [Caerostris extrusa]
MPFQQVISESIPVLRCRAMNWPRNHINLPPTQVARVYCPREREPPNCFCLVDTRACLRIGGKPTPEAAIKVKEPFKSTHISSKTKNTEWVCYCLKEETLQVAKRRKLNTFCFSSNLLRDDLS